MLDKVKGLYANNLRFMPMASKFQADPREPHLIAAKRIFKYLKGTVDLGLWYPRESDFKLIGYSDADFAGCKIDRKSTSGSYQFLGGRLVSWFSKKQKSIYTSTAEVEYIAAGSCCAQILWMKNQLLDYGLEFSKIPIYYDNQSVIAMTGNPVQHSMTKHISIRYHFIREHVMEGTVEFHFVPTDQQLADIFTKSLCEATFTRLVNELGMVSVELLLSLLLTDDAKKGEKVVKSKCSPSQTLKKKMIMEMTRETLKRVEEGKKPTDQDVPLLITNADTSNTDDQVLTTTSDVMVQFCDDDAAEDETVDTLKRKRMI
ncbi:hypothetical protein AgCh_034496 [Apium graveolens]